MLCVCVCVWYNIDAFEEIIESKYRILCAKKHTQHLNAW